MKSGQPIDDRGISLIEISPLIIAKMVRPAGEWIFSFDVILRR